MNCPNCNTRVYEHEIRSGRFGNYIKCPICGQNIGNEALKILLKRERLENED